MARKRIRRGDIYYADLRPVVGSEQGGIRPVVILQNNTGNQFSPTTIAAAITSRDEKHQLPTHIWIGGQPYGLCRESMILLEQVRTLDRKRLRDYIGCLDKETMQAVDRGLVVSLGMKRAWPEEKKVEAKMQTGKSERQRRRKMENRKKKAWIYTRIDAPEDSHGTLKKQYEQLNTYGEQLQMKIAGSSSDMGEETGLERSGLNLFLEAKDSREIEVLLILDSSRISRDKNLCGEFLRQMAKGGIEVCSPLEGILSVSPQQTRRL